MNILIKDIADLVDGKVVGNENESIRNVAKIEEAENGDLTFLYLPKYSKYLATTNASAILIKPSEKKIRNDLIYIEVGNPNLAFQKVIEKYFKPEFQLSGVDKSAAIHPSAKIGKNVAIGKNVVISENCTIGDNTKIYHNCVLLQNVTVGNDCLIFPNVTIRENCKLGKRIIIHPGTVIGSDGFGYTTDDKGVYHKIPQIGNVVIEDDVEIGANVAIDRAAIGSTVIKQGVKLDNLIQIAHNVSIGNNTVISAQSGVSGSTKIGKNCILAGQVGTVGHIELTDGVIVGAQSGVSKSIKKPGKYFGYPAKEMSTSLRLESHIRNLPDYSKRIKALEKKITELVEQLNNKEKDLT